MSVDYYDKEGRPITLLEWAHLFEDKAYCRIAEDTLDDGTWISTVWLGLDHGLGLSVRPLIFETMVFAGKARPASNLDQRRYSTLIDALLGHSEMVAEWRYLVSLWLAGVVPREERSE